MCENSRNQDRLTAKSGRAGVALNGKRSIAATIFIFLAGIVCFAHAQASAPSITKVEPPSWWANHTINPVRLLLRGRHLSGARVKAARPQTVVSDVRINSAGTYIFVSVRIHPLAKPGAYPLVVETARGKASVPFHLNTALDPKQNFQGITSDDVIYLIMTDRFSDGDVTNNIPAGSPPQAFDRRNSRAYHGGDLRGVINRLPYLKELGVTAIWLTPWYDNWNGIKTCDKPWCPSTYYHGYHAIDYYGVEDHFGDMKTLRELVVRAHALGLKIIQDQVANHVGSQHPWAKDPPLDNWFHGTLQNHLLEKFQNSTVLSPHANREEVRNTLDGWFSDDMPDMNQEEPEVARYEIQNSLWWVGMTGIDGVRQDTIQYIPRFFIRDLSNSLHRQHPRLWMVGEVFERDAAQTAFFIGGHRGWDGVDTNLDSVFDFSLWNVSLDVFTNKKPMRALRDQLKYDALYPDPARVTTLVNNHDTRRFMSIDDATLEGSMLHTAFMLTIRGTPQLYAGEEIAMEGKDDPDNRRDFPGGFPGDKRNAFSRSDRTRDEQRMWQWTRDLIKLRRDHSAIQRGQLIDLFYDDDAYAYARKDSTETVIVAINRSGSEKTITVPAAAIGLRNGTQLQPVLEAISWKSVAGGRATLLVPARTTVAYTIK
ncbi:MAG TPA: alpha-amylase family glycosyl hydrolase [Pyrinomonadaceae bacterium]|nr:alpha-amylase family glycosyl hydrolase [Pyrinomonadaceae bacterium]